MQRESLVRNAIFFKVQKITWVKLTTSGARFRPVWAWNVFAVLGASFWAWQWVFSCSIRQTTRYTCSSYSWLPRTRKSKTNGVACCSSDFRSNIFGELVASTSRRPSTFTFIYLDKEPIDCINTRVHHLAGDRTRALPMLIAGLSTPFLP